MGRKSHTRTLYCSMNGFPVGELYLRNGRMSFKYAPDWLEVEGGRAIREQMKDRLGADSARPFDLLAKVGKDCLDEVITERTITCLRRITTFLKG